MRYALTLLFIIGDPVQVVMRNKTLTILDRTLVGCRNLHTSPHIISVIA
jgi:hypothetical protein